MCTIKETKILIKNNIYSSILDILEENEIDYNAIEKTGQVGWYSIKPFEIEFGNEINICTKLYYNGNSLTSKIEFDDGNVYIFTGSHKLLSEIGIWITIDDLNSQFGIKTIDNSIKRITSLTKFQQLHTWDIHVRSSHNYILDNGIISHNY